MPEFEDGTHSRRRSFFTELLGFLLGNALQMQQAALWDVSAYAGLLVIAALTLLLVNSLANRRTARSFAHIIFQGGLLPLAMACNG
jgi:hypothetical protein